MNFNQCQWKQLIDPNKHNSSITTLTVTLDGNQVVSGSKDKTLRIWDLKTGKLLYILTGHRDQVSSVAVIPKSKHIISGSLDRTLKIWNITNFNKVLHLKSWSETVHNIFSVIVVIFLFILSLVIFLSVVVQFLKKITIFSYIEMCLILLFISTLAG
jgi:WD40 repeat protein